MESCRGRLKGKCGIYCCVAFSCTLLHPIARKSQWTWDNDSDDDDNDDDGDRGELSINWNGKWMHVLCE